MTMLPVLHYLPVVWQDLYMLVYGQNIYGQYNTRHKATLTFHFHHLRFTTAGCCFGRVVRGT